MERGSVGEGNETYAEIDLVALGGQHDGWYRRVSRASRKGLWDERRGRSRGKLDGGGK